MTTGSGAIQTSLFGTWLPTDRVQVGEYGYVRKGRFSCEGHVKQRGIVFNETRTDASPTTLGFSDRARFSTMSAMSMTTSGPAVGGALEISMSGEGAFVYQLQNIVARRIADKQSFYKDLFLSILTGKLRWQSEFLLIDEVREAGTATLIVLESQNGKLTLRGNFPVEPESAAPLAKIGSGISVDVESGSIFQAVGECTVTPLYSAKRLNFDPDPNGPGRALSEIKEWIREKIGRIDMRPDEVRMVDYFTHEDVEEIRFEILSTKQRFSIRSEHVSLEHFLQMGQGDHDDGSIQHVDEEHLKNYIEGARSAGG